MNLLFVCKHNRFRSKVAEALFRHHYKGDNVSTKSAGLIASLMHPYIPRNVVQILKRRGISIRDDGARRIEPFLLKWADNIIIVANDLEISMFKDRDFIHGKKVFVWPITDCSENDMRGIEWRINEIEKNVIDLVKIVNSK